MQAPVFVVVVHRLCRADKLVASKEGELFFALCSVFSRGHERGMNDFSIDLGRMDTYLQYSLLARFVRHVAGFAPIAINTAALGVGPSRNIILDMSWANIITSYYTLYYPL